jgi:Tol biopolymer transport system component
MNNPTRFAAAAVIGVLLLGGGFFLLRGPTGPNGTTGVTPAPATPSPSASPRSSPGPSSARSGTIIFGRHDAGTDSDHLYAIQPDGSAEHKLFDQAVCCVVLAPDGSWLTYGWTPAGGSTEAVIAKIDGTGFDPFSGPAGLNLAPAAWSSRGDFAFQGWDDKHPEKTGIYLSIDNGGGSAWGDLRRLTSRPGTDHDVPIAFSPDGSTLLFVRLAKGDDQNGDLYVIGSDGKGLRRLNPTSTEVWVNDAFGPGASWSPDGSQVAFAAFDTTKNDGTSSVYVVGVTAGTPAPIAGPGSWMTTGRWSPDGRWIAFDRGTVEHHVYVVHPDGTSETDLTAGLGTGLCCPVWSPDGAWLLAQSGEPDQGTVDLWLVPTDGSGATRLTHQPGAYKSYAWSPVGP